MVIFFPYVYRSIVGLVTTPSDFASYLLAIMIVNMLLYLSFYLIMKVSI